MQTFARAVVDRSLRLETWPSLVELVDYLLALPGIGPWTAQYIALRVFGEPDAFPANDLGLRHTLGGLPEAAITARAEAQLVLPQQPARNIPSQTLDAARVDIRRFLRIPAVAADSRG